MKNKHFRLVVLIFACSIFLYAMWNLFEKPPEEPSPSEKNLFQTDALTSPPDDTPLFEIFRPSYGTDVNPLLEISYTGEITFFNINGDNEEIIGRLKQENGTLVFEGDAEASAVMFFNAIIKNIMEACP